MFQCLPMMISVGFIKWYHIIISWGKCYNSKEDAQEQELELQKPQGEKPINDSPSIRQLCVKELRELDWRQHFLMGSEARCSLGKMRVVFVLGEEFSLCLKCVLGPFSHKCVWINHEKRLLHLFLHFLSFLKLFFSFFFFETRSTYKNKHPYYIF